MILFFLWLCIKNVILLGLRLFKGLCLLFLSNVPGATFIQGTTSIPDSRVCTYIVHKHIFVLYFILCCSYIYLYLNVDLHLTLTIRNCHFVFFVKYWIIIHCLLVEFETTIFLGSLIWFCIQSYNVLFKKYLNIMCTNKYNFFTTK